MKKTLLLLLVIGIILSLQSLSLAVSVSVICKVNNLPAKDFKVVAYRCLNPEALIEVGGDEDEEGGQLSTPIGKIKKPTNDKAPRSNDKKVYHIPGFVVPTEGSSNWEVADTRYTNANGKATFLLFAGNIYYFQATGKGPQGQSLSDVCDYFKAKWTVINPVYFNWTVDINKPIGPGLKSGKNMLR